MGTYVQSHFHLQLGAEDLKNLVWGTHWCSFSSFMTCAKSKYILFQFVGFLKHFYCLIRVLVLEILYLNPIVLARVTFFFPVSLGLHCLQSFQSAACLLLQYFSNKGFATVLLSDVK